MIFALNNLLPWFLTLTVSGRKFPRVRTHLHQQQIQKSTALYPKITQAFPVFSRMVGLVFQCLCYHLLEQFSMGELQYWKPTRRRIWLMEGRKVGRGTWVSLPGRSSASCCLFHQCSPEFQKIMCQISVLQHKFNDRSHQENLHLSVPHIQILCGSSSQMPGICPTPNLGMFYSLSSATGT